MPRRLVSLVLLALLAGTLPAAGRAPPGPFPFPAATYVRSLATDAQTPDLLYAASPAGGLYRSDDGAGHWRRIDSAPGRTGFDVVKTVPDRPGRVLAGGTGTGVWVSDDRGTTWRTVGPTGLTVADLALDPTSPGALWVLAPEGVWHAGELDAPASWRQVWDYPAWQRAHRTPDWPAEPWTYTPFQQITVDPRQPRTVLVGARWEGGYHRSDDGGATWRHETLSGLFRRADAVRVDPLQPNVMIAGTHHQGLFKSYNHGRSWVVTGRGLTPQRRTPHYAVYLLGGLASSPRDPNRLYAGSDYASWKSTDGGDTWRELDRSLTCEFARTFAVSPQDLNVVYAGTNVGVYKSRDAGATWVPANRGFPERPPRQVLDVVLDGESWRYAVVPGYPAVYRRSLTRGTDWVPMSWLLYRQVNNIRWEPGPAELVLRTPEGEVRSRDGGYRWDLPAVARAPRELSRERSPAPALPSAGGPNVIIIGAAMPDDSLLDPLYQRPPFVSLQLVSRGYPQDGSVPRWSAQWPRALQGRIAPPADAAAGGDLYVEVRDFQDGTRAGRAPYQAGPDGVTRVVVTPVHAP